ncbi:MAG: aminotransferase class III-fold pyridoxal phosphate-dependent enzyme, partial [Chitinophagaceae bacterium]
MRTKTISKESNTVIPPSGGGGAEIIQNSQDYTLFSWSKQKGSNPIAVKNGEGVYLYDYDGKRYIDFSSGLMNVNIGHGN